ncbi:MAG: amidase [Pirellulaceae bacterium]|nr:amidase [Pirellulaceae bacterium]
MLHLKSATDLRKLISTRETSAREVLEAHLQQVERVNGTVNAIVTLDAERATQWSLEADEHQAAGGDLGVLHGLPIVHKDLFSTAGMRTTFGSPIYKDHVPDADELIIQRLRAAGAISIGKSNTPEFGAGSQTFNEVFGATRNPYDLEKTCGGSSGGAAVALATRMVPIADGSDMGGSLRNPASFCNVVGFRPSTGRVPTWPSDNAWFSFGVQGPMARTVQDVSLMLAATAGPDRRVPLSIMESGEQFLEPLDIDLRGKRVAFAPTLGGLPVCREVRNVIENQRQVFTELGCEVVDACLDFERADEVFKILRAFRFAMKFGGLVDEHRALMKETVLWNIAEGQKLSGEDIANAQRWRTELFNKAVDFFDQFDFLVGPVSQVAAFNVEEEFVSEIEGTQFATYIDWMQSCYFVTATGMPAISVPAGFTTNGLPVGIQIIGGYRRDLEVLKIANAFELATNVSAEAPELALA